MMPARGREQLVLREARAADAELYDRLGRASFPWARGVPREHFRQVFEQTLRRAQANRVVMVVAELDGRFAGYSAGQPFAPYLDGHEVLHPFTPVAVLPQLAVVPGSRRRGVGAALLSETLRRLAAADYSLVIAHIHEQLREWYSRQGWTALPPSCGVTWLESPSPFNRRMLPADAPDQLVAEHTPFYEYTPMGEHGYDSIAFALTGAPQRVLAGGYFKEARGDQVTNAKRAARALMAALEQRPDVLARMPVSSRVMLYLDSLSRDQQLAAIEKMDTGQRTPTEREP